MQADWAQLIHIVGWSVVVGASAASLMRCCMKCATKRKHAAGAPGGVANEPGVASSHVGGLGCVGATVGTAGGLPLLLRDHWNLLCLRPFILVKGRGG